MPLLEDFSGLFRGGALQERFWSKVDKSGDCWLWKGAKGRDGYGWAHLTHRKMVYAHRLSWELANGSIPLGLLVCHDCDNPPCVNPAHLFLGTEADNQRDSITKNRNAIGEKNGNHKLTETEVKEIKQHGLTYERLALKFGVAEVTIWRIIRGRTWSWLH